MKLKMFALVLLGVIASSTVSAFNAFIIKDIRVEGLQHIELDTVFNYLPVKVGETFSKQKANEGIKALFETGFFNDVRMEARGGVVSVSVVERPVIAQLNINGVNALRKAQLQKAMRSNGLAESLFFDHARLKDAIQELNRYYFSRGNYAVKVTPVVSKLERNRVALTLDINEGVTARIQELRIVGANAYKESELIGQFSMAPTSWLSLITKDDQYSHQKLTSDLEKLKAFYQNHGYLEFNIDSTQVSMSDDKQYVSIVVNIREGKKFTISDLRLAGDFKVPEADLRALLQLKIGDTFNNESIAESVRLLTDALGQAGYPFANINVVHDVDHDQQTVSCTCFVDPGSKAYVRRVNISGNTKTRDEVIRRELRQLEAAPYSSDKVKRSKERLERLGYFGGISIEPAPVQGAIDQVDINIAVQEQATGSISAGIGFVQNDGLQLSADVSQRNLFGSGKHLSLGIAHGKENKNFSLSFSEPYFTQDGISLGCDFYSRAYNPNNSASYKSSSTGGTIRIGMQVTDYDRMNLTLGREINKLVIPSDASMRYRMFLNTHGPETSTTLGSMGWTHDSRDSALWPTLGRVIKVSADAGLPGGDLQYYRIMHQQTFFFPLDKTFTLMLNGELGYAGGYGQCERLPFFHNFHMGGIGSVAGYGVNSMGPSDSPSEKFGGTRKVQANAEVLFPFPGMKDNKSLRTSLFFDAGALWDPWIENSSARESMRSSVGVGLTWLSPIGPMKFTFANPLNYSKDDSLQRLQFQLGTVF